MQERRKSQKYGDFDRKRVSTSRFMCANFTIIHAWNPKVKVELAKLKPLHGEMSQSQCGISRSNRESCAEIADPVARQCPYGQAWCNFARGATSPEVHVYQTEDTCMDLIDAVLSGFVSLTLMDGF